MIRKIAVIGNRQGWDYNTIKEALRKEVLPDDILVSGGAIGVDTMTEQYAAENSHSIIIVRPASKTKEAYLSRNRIIVNISDLVIAFNKKERSGTGYTINYARKQGKPVILYKS